VIDIGVCRHDSTKVLGEDAFQGVKVGCDVVYVHGAVPDHVLKALRDL
jgi:hypothetical protein